jgi:hypothetical protein
MTIDALWSHNKNKQFTGGMTVIYNSRMEKTNTALKDIFAWKAVE